MGLLGLACLDFGSRNLRRKTGLDCEPEIGPQPMTRNKEATMSERLGSFPLNIEVHLEALENEIAEAARYLKELKAIRRKLKAAAEIADGKNN